MKSMFVINNIVMLLLIHLTSSCDNKNIETTVVQGRIINAGTKEPIDSTKITINDGVDNASGGFNFDAGEKSSSDKKNVVYTNEEGEFTVEISGEHQAWIGVSKGGYSFYKSDRDNIMGALLSYPYGVNSDVLIEMRADAKFEGFFKSTIPVNTTDTLIVFPLYYDNSVDYYWYRLFVGKQVSKFVFGSPIGDKYLRFIIEYQRNNTWNTKMDSVYISSFETYNDTIYY